MTRSSSPAPRASSQIAGTAAFSKFMHLLQLVADTPGPLTIAELSKLSGYPRPTVHRTVAALVAERLLEESPQTGRLALGPRLIQLANRSWGRSELRLASVEDLKQLRDITGETVHLAVPNGHHMVYVEKLESPSAVRMTSRIGTNVSLHSTAVGKAYLAALEETACDTLLRELPSPFTRYTPNTIITLAGLRAQLVNIRKRGWSVDDEEQEAGICCFGAAIFGRKGQPIAAISVSTLRFRQKDDPLHAYVQPLLETCRVISQRIAETPAFSETDSF
ncbi:IclR family transcriptional regulator [Cupriavidus sp. IDO]|uniref:IclR family transcriptional regulator n=1 Tax=Cupriavidus sp. IDO TaxID=1539142 RepID=UPI0005795058|nr:IclR family transcriptional regulator [Cupriavidus sp. IDO]KWR88182.1 IclR family transcriptional regulator [Cupriavidus sp. IDO]